MKEIDDSRKKDLDDFITTRKFRKLEYKKRPPDDCNDSKRKSNRNLRIKDLSELLEYLHQLYWRNLKFDKAKGRCENSLYGDAFLAFVGNEVIREFPWIDFPLTSINASNRIGKDKTGLDRKEYSYKKSKDKTGVDREEDSNNGIHYEHWMPISFFRDLFHEKKDLKAADFFYILKKYYRVVRITKEENKILDKKYKSYRPIYAYQETGINVIEFDSEDEELKEFAEIIGSKKPKDC